MLLAKTFGDDPYAWDPIGLKEGLERADHAALQAHYRRHYVPAGMVLAVSGNVKAPEVLARAEQLFGNGAGPGGGAEPDARTGALRRS